MTILPSFLYSALLFLFLFLPDWSLPQENQGLTFYPDGIAGIQIAPLAAPDNYPVIRLNSEEQILLSFDDLYGEVAPFHYQIRHVNPDNETSQLFPYEYQTGFERNPITSYQFSRNTHQSYVHYELKLPNEEVSLLLSGKYAVDVLESADAETPLFTRYFYVSEQGAEVEMTVQPSSFPELMRSHQELGLKISTREALMEPFSRVQLHVVQNNNPYNARKDLQPSFVQGKDFVYRDVSKMQWPGGNEFRFFNTNDHRYKPSQVFEISFLNNRFHFFLEPSVVRQFKRFEAYSDFDGRFRIDNAHAENPQLEADYVQVHFALPMDAPLVNEEIFILGQMNEWQVEKKYQLEYNYRTKRYEKSVYLKQGYYNYLYAVRPLDSDSLDFERLEGSHAQTGNMYQLYLFYEDPARYVRLIHFQTVHSAANSDTY